MDKSIKAVLDFIFEDRIYTVRTNSYTNVQREVPQYEVNHVGSHL